MPSDEVDSTSLTSTSNSPKSSIAEIGRRASGVFSPGAKKRHEEQLRTLAPQMRREEISDTHKAKQAEVAEDPFLAAYNKRKQEYANQRKEQQRKAEAALKRQKEQEELRARNLLAKHKKELEELAEFRRPPSPPRPEQPQPPPKSSEPQHASPRSMVLLKNAKEARSTTHSISPHVSPRPPARVAPLSEKKAHEPTRKQVAPRLSFLAGDASVELIDVEAQAIAVAPADIDESGSPCERRDDAVSWGARLPSHNFAGNMDRVGIASNEVLLAPDAVHASRDSRPRAHGSGPSQNASESVVIVQPVSEQPIALSAPSLPAAGAKKNIVRHEASPPRHVPAAPSRRQFVEPAIDDAPQHTIGTSNAIEVVVVPEAIECVTVRRDKLAAGLPPDQEGTISAASLLRGTITTRDTRHASTVQLVEMLEVKERVVDDARRRARAAFAAKQRK